MQRDRHITVCVSAEIYRQTRHLAADYDTTVSAIVAGLLEKLPRHLKNSRFPVGGWPRVPASPVSPAAPVQSVTPVSGSICPHCLQPLSSGSKSTSALEETAISCAQAVSTSLTSSVSKGSAGDSGPDTAPVRQYDPPNQHVSNDLRDTSETGAAPVCQ